MRMKTHLMLLGQAILIWFGFWLAGLPDYYQQYSQVALGIGSVLLSALISLLCLWVLARVTAARRRSIAFWLSVYYTVPFAALDTWYCGIYLGHGSSYLWQYWYLSAFYISPWLTLLPTAAVLNRVAAPSVRAP